MTRGSFVLEQSPCSLQAYQPAFNYHPATYIITRLRHRQHPSCSQPQHRVDSTTGTVTESISTTVPTDTPMPATVVTGRSPAPIYPWKMGVFIFTRRHALLRAIRSHFKCTLAYRKLSGHKMWNCNSLSTASCSSTAHLAGAIWLTKPLVFEWIWDTSGMPGQHEIQVVLDPRDVITYGDENQTTTQSNW